MSKANRSLQQHIDSLQRQLEAERKKNSPSAEMKLAEVIIENSTAILFRRLAATDPKKRKMVYVSPNISRFGYCAEDFLSGKAMFRDILYHGDFDRTLEEIHHYTSQGIEEYTMFYRIVTATGEIRWVEDRTSVVEDKQAGQRYHQGILIDIHDQRQAEQELRNSEEKYRRIVETAGEGFLLLDDSYRVLDLNSSYELMENRARQELIGKHPMNLSEQELHTLFTSGKELPGTDCLQIEHQLVTADNHKLPILIHANSLYSDRGNIIGKMAFISDLTPQKKALQLAAEVQRGLMPDCSPQVEGLDIAGLSLPCDEVGGDYFDYFKESDHHKTAFSVVIGDISGHGVDSALLMASARAFLRMRASKSGSIKDIMMDMNQQLTDDMGKTSNFMTLFYLSIDRANNSLSWVRAGHDPALLYDPATEHFTELKGPGVAVGVARDFAFTEQQQQGLLAGQVIVLTTDGILEGCNLQGEMFGKERLKAAVSKNAGKSAEAILNSIVHEYSSYTRGAVVEDDITVVVIKVTDE